MRRSRSPSRTTIVFSTTGCPAASSRSTWLPGSIGSGRPSRAVANGAPSTVTITAARSLPASSVAATTSDGSTAFKATARRPHSSRTSCGQVGAAQNRELFQRGAEPLVLAEPDLALARGDARVRIGRGARDRGSAKKRDDDARGRQAPARWTEGTRKKGHKTSKESANGIAVTKVSPAAARGQGSARSSAMGSASASRSVTSRRRATVGPMPTIATRGKGGP